MSVPKNKTRGQEIESRRLADLVPHPEQGAYNDPLSADALSRLVASIVSEGLRERPHVLPANSAGLPKNTLLDGHCRVAALKELGHKSVEVVVRYDLAGADRATIEAQFLAFNGDRKHHDQLTRARVALRRFEIERGRSRGELSADEYPEARDRVGRVIGMSGRNLARYMRVLATPDEVQQAFRERRLSLVEAEAVDGLDAAARIAIADRLRAGEPAKAVVAEFVARQPSRRHPVEVFSAWVGRAAKGAADLDRQLDDVPPHLVRHYRDHLVEVRGTIDRFLAVADAAPAVKHAD